RGDHSQSGRPADYRLEPRVFERPDDRARLGSGNDPYWREPVPVSARSVDPRNRSRRAGEVHHRWSARRAAVAADGSGARGETGDRVDILYPYAIRSVARTTGAAITAGGETGSVRETEAHGDTVTPGALRGHYRARHCGRGGRAHAGFQAAEFGREWLRC